MASTLTPARQPFGVLNDSKLRSLQSLKNRQNSIVPPSSSLKRGHVSLDLSDSENVDPVESQAWKRKRTESADEFSKPSTFNLKPIAKPTPRLSSSSFGLAQPKTPTITAAAKSDTAWTAPTAAGRSPTKSKRHGAPSNGRTRLKAPSFGGRSRATLSFTAAVEGTLANSQCKKKTKTATLEASKPKSWFFDIYEFESPEHEKDAQRVWTGMEAVDKLDISDDERNNARKPVDKKSTSDEENKENVPPNEFGAAAAGAANLGVGPDEAMSRKNMMTDEPRTPLGDLNPSDYYAKGCNAASVVLVGEDATEPENPAPIAATPLPAFDSYVEPTAAAAAAAVTEAEENTKPMTTSEITNLIFNAGPTQRLDPEEGLAKVNDDLNNQLGKVEPAEIEIWESSSAKDEQNETETNNEVFVEL